MAEDSHRGRSGLRMGTDRRVTDLVEESQSYNLLARSAQTFHTDSFRGTALELHRLGRSNPIQYGVIVYSMPYTNWYKVQLGNGGSSIGCCMMSESSFRPVGVRSTSPVPANSTVLVYVPAGLDWGIILGVIPPIHSDAELLVPDWISQDGCSGMKREDAYLSIFTSQYREGGVKNFSGGRPIDATSLEWGKMAETGVGVHVDAFQTFMRVNEACGLFLNYFDSHTRLSGIAMDICSAVHELVARDDEGEARLFEGCATYPWEALGAYSDGIKVFNEFDDRAVQFDLPKGKYDLADGEEDLQPFYRYQEYGGYLGQGRLRQVVVPARDSGKRKFSDNANDFGVFQESIGLDGAYSMRSAKQVIIGKRVLIPVAHELRLPEDQQSGDDKRKDNYKFSGKHGGGDEHKIKDIIIEGEEKHLTQVAAIYDLLAFAYNWRPQHPFHYHKEDYKLAQESELSSSGVTRAQDNLEFSELRSKTYMTYPTATPVKVDHRYNEVDYFQREAYLAMLPDGSVTIGDGYGAQITLSAGSIRLDCPGDIQLMPGRNLVAFGTDIVLRAHDSFDASAGNKDLRLKAENNLQIVGGNSGQGGVLIESKAEGKTHTYENKVGEEVESSGIVFKAANSQIVGWASEIYLRTGGDSLGSGNIVLDADRNEVVLQGSKVKAFAATSFDIYAGPAGDNSNVQAVHLFNSGGATIDKNLSVGGAAQVLGGIAVRGSVSAQGGYGSMTAYPEVSPIVGQAAAALRQTFQQVQKKIDDAVDAGERDHKSIFPDGLYQTGQAGDPTLIEQAAFSFRDDTSGEQYNVQEFKLLESRWQQMVRLGMGSGGEAWDEPKVTYQGRELLPWPGKVKWEDEDTLIQVEALKLYDAANGRSIDRPGPYEDATVGPTNNVTPKSGFKII
jgi:hypothetical protein